MLRSTKTLLRRQTGLASGSVLRCRFQGRGGARSVSRSRPKTLRLISDPAALSSNWDIANALLAGLSPPVV
jgi:hypothetical protein